MDLLFNTGSPVEFKTNLNQILDNLFNSEEITSIHLSKNVIESAKEDIKALLLNYNFDTKLIYQQLSEREWERSNIEYFIQEINKKKKSLIIASIADHNSSYGKTLRSFDWILKLVYGTSALKHLKYPIVQIKLNTVESNIKDSCIYELDKNVLLKIIQLLENIE